MATATKSTVAARKTTSSICSSSSLELRPRSAQTVEHSEIKTVGLRRSQTYLTSGRVEINSLNRCVTPTVQLSWVAAKPLRSPLLSTRMCNGPGTTLPQDTPTGINDTSLFSATLRTILCYLFLTRLNDLVILSYAIRSHSLHPGQRPHNPSVILGRPSATGRQSDDVFRQPSGNQRYVGVSSHTPHQNRYPFRCELSSCAFCLASIETGRKLRRHMQGNKSLPRQ